MLVCCAVRSAGWPTIGDRFEVDTGEIDIVDELTWQWALAAFALLALGWALSLAWLRGMV